MHNSLHPTTLAAEILDETGTTEMLSRFRVGGIIDA